MESLEKNKSQMQAPQDYEAPAIEIIKVSVEKGFALSPDTPNGTPDPEDDEFQ